MKKLLFLIVAGAAGLAAQAPTITAVLNTVEVPAGIQDTRLSPGIVATIFGTNFGSSSTGVTVTVGGTSAFVFPSNFTANQMNVQVAFNAPVGPTTVVVTVGGAASAPFNVTLLQAAPTVGFTGPNLPDIYTVKSTQVTAASPANPGDNLLLFASGLGATNPPATAGVVLTTPVSLAAAPSLTIGGVAANITSATYGASGYQINFVLPPNVQGSQPLVLSIDGQSSPAVTLPILGITAVVSGASFLDTGTATSEEIVTIYATGLGTKDEITTGYQTTTAQGVSVTFNGIAAPIFALVTEQDQMNVIVPSGLPTTGSVTVRLTTPTYSSQNFQLLMNAAVPGIFLINDPSNPKADIAAAQFANTTWLVVPTTTATALQIAQNCTASNANPLSTCGQPAAPGDYIVLYVTGLGEATPSGAAGGTPLATGIAAPANGSVLYETVATPTITIGGIAAKPLFSGIAPGFAGLYQVDFQVPTGVTEGDSVPIAISMPGSTTGTATMAIHSR
jgi:uncharacterized protein (TIGR03437 family)